MNKNIKILLIITAIVIVIAGIIAFSKSASKNKEAINNSNTNNINNNLNNQNQMKSEILGDGLQIIDEVLGTGAEATIGSTVSVNYVGTLTNGNKFDSSYDRNEPYSFVLGAQEVIAGWDEGVPGMRVGGKRKLVIPPELAYGAQNVGNGLIPPNSTLIFEVELLGVEE